MSFFPYASVRGRAGRRAYVTATPAPTVSKTVDRTTTNTDATTRTVDRS